MVRQALLGSYRSRRTPIAAFAVLFVSMLFGVSAACATGSPAVGCDSCADAYERTGQFSS